MYLKTISIFLNSCIAGFPKRSFSFFQGIICFPRYRIRKNLWIFISPQVPIQFNRAKPRRSDRTDHLLFPTLLSHLAKRPEDCQGAATSSAQVLLQKYQSPARREPPQASLLPIPAREAGAPSTSSIFTTRACPGTTVSPSAVSGEGATAAAASQEWRAAKERSPAWRPRRQNTSAVTGWRRSPQWRHSRLNGRQPSLTAASSRAGRYLRLRRRCRPARGGAAVRALRSHWLPARKSSRCLRGGCGRAALRRPRTWRRRGGGSRSSSSSSETRWRMAAGRCRGSRTGWTCGSSSSSTWRSSWSSTCCPEGAGPRSAGSRRGGLPPARWARRRGAALRHRLREGEKGRRVARGWGKEGGQLLPRWGARGCVVRTGVGEGTAPGRGAGTGDQPWLSLPGASQPQKEGLESTNTAEEM